MAATRPALRPKVKLGALSVNGIAPSVFALVERGIDRRARVARSLAGEVEIRYLEKFAPTRIVFSKEQVLVEDVDPDGPRDPDLVISGSLPDIVQLAAAPMAGGVPKLTRPEGRAALRRVASRQVRIKGSPLLARRLLKLLEL